jgi:beta-lactamase regulating signal transducer with metallopeptidase domain
MKPLLTTVADYLLSQSWQIAAVFVLVAVACWGLRKASAHWRYWLWLVVLAKCLVPAVISVPLPVLPQKAEVPQKAEAKPKADVLQTALSATTMSAPAAMPTPVPDTVAESEPAIENSEPVAAAAMPLPHEVHAPADVPAAKTILRLDLNVRDWLAIGWLAGMGLFLVWTSIGTWTTHRRLRHSRRLADQEMRRMVAALAERLGVKSIPSVYMADGIAQPFVWGWLRGSIYLPEQFVGTGTGEQQQAILTHELAHVARWDAAANLVQIVTQTIFFFHPLIWWTNRQIRREREKCCDEIVIAGLGADPKQYSQAIVNALVAEYEASQPIPSLAVAGRLQNIEERIQTILKPNRRFYRRPSWAVVATVVCLATCAIPTTLILTARGGSAEPQSAIASPPTSPAATDIAGAEDCALTIKRLESSDLSRGNDAIYRATSPQHFFMQWRSERNEVVYPGNRAQTAAFNKIVKKEPEYALARPFRGVAKLGSQEYAFALDFVDPRSQVKKTKPDAKDAKQESPIGSLFNAIIKELGGSESSMPPKTTGYNRLYFDFNRNGDLTDDKVIEGEVKALNVSGPQSYAQIEFPRVDLTIDVDGIPLDYAFFLTGYVNASKDFGYTAIQIKAAVYREGDIILEGKKRHIVLIDFNSNGRFDDETKVIRIRRGMNRPEEAYPQVGDMLLIDPASNNPGMDSPYDVTSSKIRHYVSKLVNLDGNFYNLKVSPVGDRLTLTPSSVAVGAVTNPNAQFRAVIYGDQGFLKINGTKDAPIAVPEGEWKLLSYAIDLTGVQEPSKPADKKASPEGKSLLDSLAKAAETILGGRVLPGGRYRNTFVAAQASADSKAIKVGKGETVALPFGPPYKPVVTSFANGAGAQMEMELSLIGSAGEICSNMMVDGNRPPKPHFTIKDSNGEVVQQGDFEYGGGFTRRYSWRVPSDPAKEYHVHVEMQAGPFDIDRDNDSVIHPRGQ